MPEKDFTEIKFDTKIGREMAFTMTKIRNHVIAKVNERAKTLQQFKDDGLNEMMAIDILQEIQTEPQKNKIELENQNGSLAL